ncbi:MAG: Lrp/AsnC family transcriptional regulator [Candidatus ainarchaeum sp.]|nr:Lrp/AsnC family transcriptional regulator [Candidatus ainarchaeum sp.]
MKNIEEKLIKIISKGECTPKITSLAKKTKEPGTTIQYNIKRMEREGKILAYKAVMNQKKINRGFCTYVLMSISSEEYGNPEKIARELEKFEEIENIAIVTGDWELVIKVWTKDSEEYYGFLRTVLSRKGITKIKSLTTLKTIKSEFISF